METKKPNILILYSDQHSARTLGCYGNKEVLTPNLDKLASEGIRFDNAYTQNPICTPSRMCLFSGQYVHNFGYYGLMGEAPTNLPNMFGYLKNNGYFTGMAGKTHTPTGWLAKDCDFVGDGYGYEILKDDRMYHLFDGLQGLKIDEYNSFLAENNMLDKRDDKVYHECLDENGHKKGQGLDARPSRLHEDYTIEAWSAMKINSFIDVACEKHNPFCLWLTVPKPHQTYVPSKKFWDMYDEKKLTLPPNSENDMKGRHANAKTQQKVFKESTSWMSFEPKTYDAGRKRVLHGYYANVTQMDDAMGRVIDHLDALNIRDDTIIIYLTDHGEFAGEHGMIEKAPGIAFRCCTKIPMIISWKGKIKQNEARNNLVESVDILPSLCELAGIEAPDWVDGKSFVPMLNFDCEIKDIAVTENPYTKTIHTQKYKFTQYIPETNNGKDFGELYDIENDPWEMNNLYFDSRYKETVQELRYKLYCWLIRTTRHKTVNPSMTNNKGIHSDWDVGQEFYAQDKKVKQSFIDNVIENDNLNYI